MFIISYLMAIVPQQAPGFMGNISESLNLAWSVAATNLLQIDSLD